MITKNQAVFVVYDQPRFAGAKMFMAFIVLLLSFLFLIVFPLHDNYGSYILLWIVLGVFFLLREKKEIDSINKEIISTIYFGKIKYVYKFDIDGFDALVVKLFWEDTQMAYSKLNKQVVGGTSVFLLKLNSKEFVLLETFSSHREAKSLIDFCTDKLKLEIRDEYQERVDASKLKRKFGIYR